MARVVRLALYFRFFCIYPSFLNSLTHSVLAGMATVVCLALFIFFLSVHLSIYLKLAHAFSPDRHSHSGAPRPLYLFSFCIYPSILNSLTHSLLAGMATAVRLALLFSSLSACIHLS